MAPLQVELGGGADHRGVGASDDREEKPGGCLVDDRPLDVVMVHDDHIAAERLGDPRSVPAEGSHGRDRRQSASASPEGGGRLFNPLRKEFQHGSCRSR